MFNHLTIPHNYLQQLCISWEERIGWWKQTLWKHNGWRAKHKAHDDNTESRACRWGWASGVCRAGGSAYCTSSSSKFSSAAFFRGRPRWMWRPRLNSSSSTVQKDPNSSSTLTKHLCRERLVRMAPWESKPAGGQPDADAVIDGTDRGRTHTQTQGGGERVRIKMKKSHCGLWGITKRLLKAWREGTPKQEGTLDVMAHRQWDEAAVAAAVSSHR